MFLHPSPEWNQLTDQNEADQKFQFTAIEFIFFISIIFLNVQKIPVFSFLLIHQCKN